MFIFGFFDLEKWCVFVGFDEIVFGIDYEKLVFVVFDLIIYKDCCIEFVVSLLVFVCVI